MKIISMSCRIMMIIAIPFRSILSQQGRTSPQALLKPKKHSSFLLFEDQANQVFQDGAALHGEGGASGEFPEEM